MRVAILGDYPLDHDRIRGGVEAVISYLVSELKKFEDLELHVVTLREDVRQRCVYKRENDFTVHYLPAAYRFANVTFFAVNKVKLLRELAVIRPDLIHAHVAGTYAEVAYMTGLPTVLTLHGIRYRGSWLQRGWVNRLVRRPLITREERAGVRKARHIIAISPYICEEFGSLIRATVYPIENPIADRFFQIQNHEEPGRILYAGRIAVGKGIPHLIQAFACVHDHVPTARLYLAGRVDDDSCWQLAQSIVQNFRLDRVVHFLGPLDEDSLLKEYERCTLLVLPSCQETAPMVIQQAMAAGKAVIATRIGGVPYLVSHGETGLLVDYGDVTGLAEAIIHLLSDDTLRTRMGEQAQKEAFQRFRAAVVARQTYEVYHKIVEEHDLIRGKPWEGFLASMTQKWLESS